MAKKAAENLNNDELRYFIGEEEFKDSVRKWKEVRYHYYFFIFLPPHFSQVLPEIKERERENERERERERKNETMRVRMRERKKE